MHCPDAPFMADNDLKCQGGQSLYQKGQLCSLSRGFCRAFWNCRGSLPLPLCPHTRGTHRQEMETDPLFLGPFSRTERHLPPWIGPCLRVVCLLPGPSLQPVPHCTPAQFPSEGGTAGGSTRQSPLRDQLFSLSWEKIEKSLAGQGDTQWVRHQTCKPKVRDCILSTTSCWS